MPSVGMVLEVHSLFRQSVRRIYWRKLKRQSEIHSPSYLGATKMVVKIPHAMDKIVIHERSPRPDAAIYYDKNKEPRVQALYS